MFTYILLIFSSLALTTAIRINVGPQTFSDQQSLKPLPRPDERFVNNQEFRYLIPVQNNAQNVQAENQQSSLKNYERQISWPFIKFLPSGELQVQNLGQIQGAPVQNQKPKNENSQEGLEFLKSFSEQRPKQQYQLVRYQQGKQPEREPVSFNGQSNEQREENYLSEQIQQELKRIVENNQGRVSGNNQFSKVVQSEQEIQSNNQEEQENAAVRKEIENILRARANSGVENQAQEVDESNYQKSPFFIHRLVRVTKHHPVNIVKEVKVPVPTPVLVPVPEPYEVRVPQPYQVPVEVIRHIPIPVVRAH